MNSKEKILGVTRPAPAGGTLLLVITLLLSCNEKTPKNPPPPDASQTEAREDSLALAAAYAAQGLVTRAVPATAETGNAHAATAADAADDPAIWVHPADPARSLVYGSNKTGGLAAYDLAGTEVAYYPVGNINNVDVIYDFPLADGTTATLLGGTNRTIQGINLWRIDPADGSLTALDRQALLVDRSVIDDVYGFCFARAGEDFYAVLNGKNGVLEQYRLRADGTGGIAWQLARRYAFPSQTEGMVADTELGRLYVGEEAAGIWSLPIDPAAADSARLIVDAGVGSNPAIVADVEGLTLVPTGPGAGYLIASIQGSFSYALFDRAGENAYLGSFKIIGGSDIDGAEETDGLDATPRALGTRFPHGLLVVQDGFNYDGDTTVPQNFKYVDLGRVLKL